MLILCDFIFCTNFEILLNSKKDFDHDKHQNVNPYYNGVLDAKIAHAAHETGMTVAGIVVMTCTFDSSACKTRS